MREWVRLPDGNFLNMGLVVGVDFAEGEALVWHTMDIEGAQNPWRFRSIEAIDALRKWVELQTLAAPEGEVAEAMVEAALEAAWVEGEWRSMADDPHPTPSTARLIVEERAKMRRIVGAAMRAARPAAPTPSYAADVNVWRAIYDLYEKVNASKAAAPTQETGEELRLLRELRGKLRACGSYSDWIAAAKEGAWMRIVGADAAFIAHRLAKLATLDAAGEE